MNGYTVLGLSLILVVGCGKSKSAATVGRDGGPATSADAAATVAAADAAPAADAAAAAGGLVARADGVGPLAATTKVTAAALAAAFPDHQVKKVSRSHGGDLLEEYYAVSKGDAVVLRVQFTDDTLSAVDVLSPEIPNPLGIKVGATHAEVITAIGQLYCANAGDDTDWRSDIVVCTSARSATYSLDFEAEGRSAAELLEDADQLAKATVVAVTWQASPSGPPTP